MSSDTIQKPEFNPAAVLAAALNVVHGGLYDVEGIGAHLSCNETAALGALYVAAGRPGAAEHLLLDHTEEDHPEDSCTDYSECEVRSAEDLLASLLPDVTVSVWVAVVEWDDTTGEPPAVFVGTDEQDVTRRAHVCVAAYTREISEHREAGRWLAENPAPPADATAQMLADWYEGWHDATGDGWVTVTEERVQ